jgi:RNA polymerase-binding transcription factor DksA
MNTNKDILEKIRKLLRLADTSRGATESEAQVALAKAQELMTRHNIDSALLRMERGESGHGFAVDKGKVDLPKTLNPADLMILSLLQGHFNVKTILMPNGRGTPVDIIGSPADIDFAIYVFHYLRQTFFRCWNEFKRVHANPDKASYYRGLRDGLNTALKEAKQRAEESYGSGERQTYGLVLVDQQAAIKQYVDEHYGKLRKRSGARRKMHSGSYTAGESKGRTIQINRPLPS